MSIEVLNSLGDVKNFQPKIVLTIDDDLTMSGSLTPETKKALQILIDYPETLQTPSKILEVTDKEAEAKSPTAPPGEDAEVSAIGDTEEDTVFETDEDLERLDKKKELIQRERQKIQEQEELDSRPDHHPRILTITLRADSEFFHLLTNELSSIDKLQENQKKQMILEVSDLGREIQMVTKPTGSAKKSSDLYMWREIFALYRDASVFYGAAERERGSRTAEQANQHLQWFKDQLKGKHMVSKICCTTYLLGNFQR